MARKAKSLNSEKKKTAQPAKTAHEHETGPKKASLFIDVTPDKYFVLCDGKTLKDYRELASMLETVNDDVFFYHVNSERNDFANWINDVFGEEKLANDVRSAKSRIEIMAIIYKHLFNKLSEMMK